MCIFFIIIAPCSHNTNCFGCFKNEDTCLICSGSSKEDRAIRKRSDDGSCNCQDEYFDTNDIDCQCNSYTIKSIF